MTLTKADIVAQVYAEGLLTKAEAADVSALLELASEPQAVLISEEPFEDWALVDNLSNGRAGMALASGWQPNVFLVRPDAFEKRKEILLESVETLVAMLAGSFDLPEKAIWGRGPGRVWDGVAIVPTYSTVLIFTAIWSRRDGHCESEMPGSAGMPDSLG